VVPVAGRGRRGLDRFLVVLFTGSCPRALFDFLRGWMRWQTRMNAWVFGLVDRYPPFSLE